MNDRTMQIMKLLVEQYLQEGQPVSSKCLANSLTHAAAQSASPATIRNVMMNLEKSGLLKSPHTSAGRVPTPSGLRFFVDELLTISPIEGDISTKLKQSFSSELTPSQLCQQASEVLSEMTAMTGIVTVPQLNQTKIEKIEFIRLTERRLICVLVMHDGEIQNRIIELPEIISQTTLEQTSFMMNKAVSGKTLTEGLQSIKALSRQSNSQVACLSSAALDMASQNQEYQNCIHMTGESRLLDVNISQEFERLRNLFETVSDKKTVLDLMQRCSDADGVKIFIGQESGLDDLIDCSIVSAPYEANGDIVGRLAVIGGTRMNYRKVIPIVDMTARLLTLALNRND